jgi:hypothetical protein
VIRDPIVLSCKPCDLKSGERERERERKRERERERGSERERDLIR